MRQLPHVVAVAPVVTQLSTGGTVEVIDGIDLASFEAMGGPFRYIAGGPYQDPNDVLIDDYVASSKHLKVGDSVELLNHTFRVSGIVEHGKGAQVPAHCYPAGHHRGTGQGVDLLREARRPTMPKPSYMRSRAFRAWSSTVCNH